MLPGLADPSWAIFVPVGKEVPVDRLVKNLEQYVASHKDDARAYYLLGRVHAMAFTNKSDTVRTAEPDWTKPLDDESNRMKFAPYDKIQQQPSFTDTTLPDDLRQHLQESIANYRRAVELDTEAPNRYQAYDDQRLFRLGLAWMMEVGTAWADQLGAPPSINKVTTVPDDSRRQITELLDEIVDASPDRREPLLRKLAKVPGAGIVVAHVVSESDKDSDEYAAVVDALKFLWRETTLEVNREAYKKHWETERKKESMYFNNDLEEIISFEAAKGIQRILATRQQLTDAEREEQKQMQESIEHFKSLPQYITPIIVGGSEEATLEQSLAEDHLVTFDLDGTGRGHQWPWVKPDTGILVWDPEGTGQITSGKQLFGSVTWWLFCEHGYQALASLDDDTDGTLRGDELQGIGIWKDRNSNGVADAGEVVPAIDQQVTAIAVHFEVDAAGVRHQRQGVLLANGQVLPTFDWVPQSRLP
jgi:hypothetical protein